MAATTSTSSTSIPSSASPPPAGRAAGRGAIPAIATTQHGHFTIGQALDAGMSARTLRRRKHDGELREPQPGVFVAATQPPSFEGECIAAVLSLPMAALAGRASAALHGIDGFTNAPTEIVVPRGGPNRRTGVVLHRAAIWLPDQVVAVRGIATSSLPWTLVQLASLLDDHRLEHALDDALRLGTSTTEVRSVLGRIDARGLRGYASLRRLLNDPMRSGVVPDSWFERLVEHALAVPDLPPAVRQHRVIEAGRFLGRVDLAYPIVRVAVEAQSRRHHGSPAARREDRRRIAKLREGGWEVVEWWWDDLADAAEAVALVRHACRRQAERYGIDPFVWQPVRQAS